MNFLKNKYVVIKGGLGNQIFQYNLINYLHNSGYHVKYLNFTGDDHNGIEITKYFNFNWSEASLFIYLLYKISKKLKLNSIFCYDKNLNINKIFFEGYWYKPELYMSPSEYALQTLILNEKNIKIKHIIEHKNSVSLHVRRGDYLLPKNFKGFGNICTIDYYKRAIDYINCNIINPTYFIFSDDIQWCKDNLKLDQVYYIDWNKNEKSIIDFYLMSLCKHHIIANSSFSFWAAYISGDNQVLYPEKWSSGRDIQFIPKSWIKISINS
ncbi:alpha-1,2-fucosyltransferase [Segatella bryantii]|uniref:alpha-1,2-fucosyltransferase n=1 Tax=Segatella bryantii TaxID=77095 RepID=UPI00241E3C3C|nr:alpha-1,2-fucosyltransferase [Segatella bryantii]